MRNALSIVVLALCSTAAFAQTIEPGLYEITTKSPAGTNTVKQCLTAKDISSGLRPEMDKSCKSIRANMSGGKLDYASTCTDMSMTMTGSYTTTSYVIDGKLTMKGDDDAAMETHIAGKRLSATCPAS